MDGRFFVFLFRDFIIRGKQIVVGRIVVNVVFFVVVLADLRDNLVCHFLVVGRDVFFVLVDVIVLVVFCVLRAELVVVLVTVFRVPLAVVAGVVILDVGFLRRSVVDEFLAIVRVVFGLNAVRGVNVVLAALLLGSILITIAVVVIFGAIIEPVDFVR